MAQFFEFVKKKKDDDPAKVGLGPQGGQQQVLLPHSGGLFMPGGKPFPASALQSLDFRRAMSFMSG